MTRFRDRVVFRINVLSQLLQRVTSAFESPVSKSPVPVLVSGEHVVACTCAGDHVSCLYLCW